MTVPCIPRASDLVLDADLGLAGDPLTQARILLGMAVERLDDVHFHDRQRLVSQRDLLVSRLEGVSVQIDSLSQQCLTLQAGLR